MKTLTIVAAILLVGLKGTLAAAQTLEAATRPHESPQSVFEQFRQAAADRNWRAVFDCLTPEAKNAAVFEAYFVTQLDLDNPRIDELLVKHHVARGAIELEFARRFKIKHGVDISKVLAGQRTTSATSRSNDAIRPGHPSNAPTGGVPRDDNLLRQVVAHLIVDKSGFYEDVRKAKSPPTATRLGGLTNLSISGDTARGQGVISVTYIRGEGASPPRQQEQLVKHTYRFRRIMNSWLMEEIP